MTLGKAVKRHFARICLLNLVSFIFVMVFTSTIMQDRLLFKTDWLTLGYFLLMANFLLLLTLLIPFYLLLHFLKKTKLDLRTFYARIVTFLIFYSILMNLFNNPFVFQTQSAGQLWLVNLLCAAAAAFIAGKICDRTIFARIRPVARLLMLAAVIFVLSAKTYFFLQKHAPQADKPKNVIMVVLDSLSTSCIREYNPEATLAIEDISADYALFENIRTNFTYTYGYFDALFSGGKSGAKSRAQNLLSLLQKNGVNTCWLAAQGNAVPDNHAVKNYKGLRSYFFNYRFSWLPALLGIDYNMYRTPFKKDGYLIYSAHRAIDFIVGRKTDFAGEVDREIERLKNDGRPFFFLIHEFPACETSDPNKLWEPGDIKDRRDQIRENIKNNDFHYAEQDEWLVREWEAKALADARAGFACLQKIQDFLKTNGWDKDTLLILTADHGKMFKNGKVWYGFHNDEEVARVPLVVFNSPLSGRKAGLGETIDITRTLLQNFQVKQTLDPDALSLFGNRQKDTVTTLSEYSKVRGEQFLNVYKKNAAGTGKFVVDPVKKDFYNEYLLEGFRELFIKKTAFHDSPMQVEFEKIFDAYGIR
jgi:hypothetical protein